MEMKRQYLWKFVLTVGALIVTFPGWNVAFAEQDPSPVPAGIIEVKEGKSETGGPTIREEPAPAPERRPVEPPKSGVSPEATAAQSRQPPPLDRRWIIKMKDGKETVLKAREPAPIAWADDDQKARCETYAAALREAYGKTRHFSVNGDACSTAAHAREFLSSVEGCSRDCPEGYLESNGYSEQIIWNVTVLQELGQKRCLQPVTENHAGNRVGQHAEPAQNE